MIIPSFPLKLVPSLLAAFFFASITLTPNSYSFGAVLIALISLVVLFKTYSHIKHTPVFALSLALFSYFFIYFFSFIYHNDPASTLDLPSRTLLAITALLFFIHYPPKINWIFYGIILGSFITGIIACYHHYFLHIRVFSEFGYMVIQIGGICAWLACLSSIGFIYFKEKKQIQPAYLCLIGSSLALAATLLSGARGAWVPLPIVLPFILWATRYYLTKSMLFSLVAAWCIAFTLALPEIEKRVDAVVIDMQHYEKENSDTSSGARLEMWKSALYSFMDHPITGYGHTRLNEAKKQQIEENLVDSVILKYSRAHNQYLEELQSKGLIGLSGLTLLFGIPFCLFTRYLTSNVRQDKTNSTLFFSSLMGISHLLLVAGFALTQHYLNHHSGILMFCFGLVIFSALTIHQASSKTINID